MNGSTSLQTLKVFLTFHFLVKPIPIKTEDCYNEFFDSIYELKKFYA